jgi:ribosomal-protein-alanine N-acetyltransferase
LTFSFAPMDQAHAREILTWRYEAPYDVYNPDPAKYQDWMQAFLDPGNAYHAIADAEGKLVAYCCFGPDARVPGGDYHDEALDIGLGARPDLTGQGHGPTFARAVLEFARATFAPAAFRVTVAEFNQRALRVWEKIGFRPVQTFASSRSDRPFVILVHKP